MSTLTEAPTERTLGSRFQITGPSPLGGRYRVQGNKNAALPLICASLLARERVLLRNAPRILDVDHLLELAACLGVQSEWRAEGLFLDSRDLRKSELPADQVRKLRGAILILGAVASDFENIHCALPGGCPIGRRSFEVHWRVFEAGGFRVEQDQESVSIQFQSAPPEREVYLEEASVTATENALLLFASLGGGTILNPAREPHVFDLIQFLEHLGCKVQLHPLFFQIERGPRAQTGPVEWEVPADYIDAGTIAVAAAACGGRVQLEGVSRSDMMGIEPVLGSFGIEFDWADPRKVAVQSVQPASPDSITAGPWPLFPTDLVSLAIILATQRSGLCLIHDWMYEGRMFFVDKLIRMGAAITMCDPHRVLVEGPKALRGKRLESPDIRAGMALVVAGLCAEGITTIEHGDVIKRGYERIVERLQGIGAKIEEC
jgi:UDP-N-acetylglucosamine 1-carboxyvinyltransferase